jgi:hypothetical protein
MKCCPILPARHVLDPPWLSQLTSRIARCVVQVPQAGCKNVTRKMPEIQGTRQPACIMPCGTSAAKQSSQQRQFTQGLRRHHAHKMCSSRTKAWQAVPQQHNPGHHERPASTTVCCSALTRQVHISALLFCTREMHNNLHKRDAKTLLRTCRTLGALTTH